MTQLSVETHGLCVRKENRDADLASCGRNENNPRLQRKSPRAYFHDYSGGNYFVTICTQDKKHYFGKITNGEMHFTAIGEYCRLQLEEISLHYPYAENMLSVVMPNHIHAIFHINSQSVGSGDIPNIRTLLSVVVGGLKRSVTIYARRNNIVFDWQGRYHDHIIRDSCDGNNITEYIENNVSRWDTDCYNER